MRVKEILNNRKFKCCRLCDNLCCEVYEEYEHSYMKNCDYEEGKTYGIDDLHECPHFKISYIIAELGNIIQQESNPFKINCTRQ